MRTFSIVLIYAFTFLCGPAWAGTYIGNGGGIAELQAIKAAEDLGAIATLCGRNPSYCAHLQKAGPALKSALDRYPGWVQVTFDNSESAPPLRWAAERAHQLIVHTGALYDEDKPKPYGEISSLIYSAVLDVPRELGQKIFTTFKSETFSLSTRVNSRATTVQLAKGSRISDQLFLLAVTEAYDLNKFFASLPLCSDSASAVISFDQLFWSGTTNQSAHLSGKIAYRCSSAINRGDFHLFLPFTAEGLLIEDRIRVTYSYLHSEKCAGLLSREGIL